MAVDYTSRDYTAIRKDLLDRASTLIPEWTSRDASDFGVTLVELWAYMGDILHYYIDRTTQEMFLETASQRESVLAIANLLDYIPNRRAPASAQIRVSCPTSAASVSIPAGTVFVAPAVENQPSIYFTADSSTLLAPYQGLSTGANPNPVTINLTEGVIISEESLGLSNGLANQRKALFKKNVSVSNVAVSVYEGPLDGDDPTAVAYSRVDRILGSEYTAPVFFVDVAADGTSYVVFGNGISGRVPQTNAEIKATYRVCSGSAGNVAAGRITRSINAIQGLVVTPNSVAASGGRDEETMESMRASIPAVFRTQDRAVSLKDFEDLCKKVAGVSKVKASWNGSVVSIYPVEYQADYLTSASTTLVLPTATQERVEEYLEPRTMVGASVSVLTEVTTTPINVSGTIHISDDYVAAYVSESVVDSLDQLFSFQNVEFGDTIRVGQVYRAILNTPGVEYASLTVLSTTGSGLNDVTVAATALPKKGTYTFSVTGGITGNSGVI